MGVKHKGLYKELQTSRNSRGFSFSTHTVSVTYKDKKGRKKTETKVEHQIKEIGSPIISDLAFYFSKSKTSPPVPPICHCSSNLEIDFQGKEH